MSRSHLLIGALAISLGTNVIQYANGEKDHLNKAALKLSAFGAELGKISKDMPLTEEQKIQIGILEEFNLPVIKAIANNVVLTHGTNFVSSKPVVLQSTTGREIKSCGEIKEGDDSVDFCNMTVVNPSGLLRGALTVREPIKGKIRINYKEVPATYIINVTAKWQGSHCSALTGTGSAFKDCVDIPGLN